MAFKEQHETRLSSRCVPRQIARNTPDLAWTSDCSDAATAPRQFSRIPCDRCGWLESQAHSHRFPRNVTGCATRI